MKDIMESPEVFDAYARIDYNMFLIQKWSDELEQNLSPKEVLQCKKNVHQSMRQIIEDKKFIGADYSNTETALAALEAMTPNPIK